MAKILINCLDYMDESMAGPAIRSWEFANALSKNHQVVVLTPNTTSLNPKDFVIKKITKKVLEYEIKNNDFYISQTILPRAAKLARKYNTRTILDAYDPMAIESLEANKSKGIGERILLNKLLLTVQSSSFCFADSVICASEKQRDLWLGVLSTMNKITPNTYDEDNSLRNLIDVVPFGISSKNPVKQKSNIFKQKFGIDNSDFVLLWGGGIWNWFDPLTLIKAVTNLKDKLHVKLVFMGIDHPNKNIPRMAMVEKAIKTAKELDPDGEIIFFNEGWVPYKERQKFLSSADVGVSTHYDHLETRFSFRTRILDYLWSELPIIATQGDSFAELIEERHLGEVVRYRDEKSIEQAILRLATDKKYYDNIKNNISSVKKEYYWEVCVQPIERMVEYWSDHTPEKSVSVNTLHTVLAGLYRTQKVIAKKIIKSALRIK